MTLSVDAIPYTYTFLHKNDEYDDNDGSGKMFDTSRNTREIAGLLPKLLLAGL